MRHLAHYLMAVMLAIMAGCATTPPSRFYILEPVKTDAAAQPSEPATAVGVGPVELPKYLDRPQIVVRSGANELFYDETRKTCRVWSRRTGSPSIHGGARSL